MKARHYVLAAALIAVITPTILFTQTITEAPAGFDNKTNGFTTQATFDADLATFEEFETTADGLGPVYNAQSCRECHQNPVTGAGSQIVEVRVGHLGDKGQFIFPSVPIIGDVIKGRTLINDRAICEKAQEHVPPEDNIRTNRLSLSI